MVRSYKRKTNRDDINEKNINLAIKDIVENKTSYRAAAINFNVNFNTLFKRVKRLKEKKSGELCYDSGQSDEDNSTLVAVGRGKFKIRQIFSDYEESLLKKYLIKSSQICYGLTRQQARALAYEYAVKLNLKYPISWDSNKKAGEEWIKGFMKRHIDLSIRKPENTSLARAVAFNKTNVEYFFRNYLEVQTKYKFAPNRILNLDESGIPTVLECPKVRYFY